MRSFPTSGQIHPVQTSTFIPVGWARVLAGLGSLMRSRLIPKERPKSSGWRARWYSWKCTPARNRKPYEMRAGWNASELPGLPKLHFHSSDPPLFLLPFSLSLSFSLQMKSRYGCTKPRWIDRNRLIFKSTKYSYTELVVSSLFKTMISLLNLMVHARHL